VPRSFTASRYLSDDSAFVERFVGDCHQVIIKCMISCLFLCCHRAAASCCPRASGQWCSDDEGHAGPLGLEGVCGRVPSHRAEVQVGGWVGRGDWLPACLGMCVGASLPRQACPAGPLHCNLLPACLHKTLLIRSCWNVISCTWLLGTTGMRRLGSPPTSSPPPTCPPLGHSPHPHLPQPH
jgi:hypothetical protein